MQIHRRKSANADRDRQQVVKCSRDVSKRSDCLIINVTAVVNAHPVLAQGVFCCPLPAGPKMPCIMVGMDQHTVVFLFDCRQAQMPDIMVGKALSRWGDEALESSAYGPS